MLKLNGLLNKNKSNKIYGYVVIFIASIIYANCSYASIVINGTRILYPSDAKEVSVRINNNGTSPVLIQSWIDQGITDVKPEDIKVPFILTPPINRIDPKKGQTLIISSTENSLPKDRESIYWLNVLEVPAKKLDGKDKNYFQMAFRTRIKIFYRPSNLREEVSKAVSKIKWNTSARKIKVTNPTPFYITFVNININGRRYNPFMVPPLSSTLIEAYGAVGDKVNGAYLNDHGAAVNFDSQIN